MNLYRITEYKGRKLVPDNKMQTTAEMNKKRAMVNNVHIALFYERNSWAVPPAQGYAEETSD